MPIFGDVTKLVAGITNITTLHLSPDSLEGLVHRVTNKCGYACPCISVKHKEEEEEEEVCCLLTCHVKVLEISDYRGSSQEVKQMRHFLGKLKCLEYVKVSVDRDKDNSELLRTNLPTLPSISS